MLLVFISRADYFFPCRLEFIEEASAYRAAGTVLGGIVSDAICRSFSES